MGILRFPRFVTGAVLREAAGALASLFFPAPCRLCERPLLTASRIPICRDCLDALGPLAGPICEVCGLPFISAEAGLVPKPLCGYCRRELYHFDLARSYAAYDEPMVRAITLLKYSAVTPLGRWFAARLADLLARYPELSKVDVVVPVPLHSTRLRERGYNQAELIAQPLARRLRLPCRSYLLVRTRPRPSKLKLTRRERWETVRGAYATRESARVDNLRVMLVDDVFTTGATLDSCARALKAAGAARVVGLTVARAVPDAWQPNLAREVVLQPHSGDLSQ